MALSKEQTKKLKQTYNDAKRRCENENCSLFKYYGGRGIEFKFNSFEEFINELGNKPDSTYSLDRIDNNGNYESGNVKWSSKSEQVINRRYYEKPWLNGNTHNVKKYVITHPNGDKEIITNMAKFCRENELNKGNLHKTIKGELAKTHKGFKAEVA